MAIGNRHSASPSPPPLSIVNYQFARQGFTLIELLVVIGIILVLIGLFFAGAKIVTAQAKTRDTQIALETCRTMFENYKQATHLTRLPPGMSTTSQGDPYWVSPATFSWTTSQEPAVYNPAATNTQIATDTAYVMYAIESLPENQKIITSLPASKVTTFTITISTSSGPGPGPGSGTTVSVPLILDGWGNPIFFVPGGGLGTNVNPVALVSLDGVNQGIVTSVGPITGTSTPFPLNKYPPPAGTPLNNQPFFVSAGPDGDISNFHPIYHTAPTPTDFSACTDDNVYSFNN